MYTRCPNCTTIFRVTAEQLRTTYGDIPCMTCAQLFNALDSLSDDITALITTPVTAVKSAVDTTATVDQPLPVREEAPADLSLAADDVVTTSTTDDDAYSTNEIPDTDIEANAPIDVSERVPADDDQPVDAMEFDAPEQTWSKFFLVNEIIASQQDADHKSTLKTEAEAGGTPLEKKLSIDDTAIRQPWIDNDDTGSFEFQTANHLEWKKFLVELNDDAATGAAENEDRRVIEEPDPVAAAKPALEPITEPDPVAASEPKFEPVTKPDPFADAEPAFEQPAESDPLIDLEPAFERSVEPDPLDDVEPALDVPAEPDPFDYSNPALDPATGLDPIIYAEQVPDVETEQQADTSILPLWLSSEMADDTPPTSPESRRSWAVPGACAALALFLAGQLLHHNRDALAATADYGAAVRQVYALFDASLYPDWPLDAFEVTGTEAISGGSSENALDILANVIVRGQESVGLPLIRVVLRDRWSNPVATRVFTPHEYLREFDTTAPPVNPGAALPVEISVADPGAEALGYVVDVCLPRRKTGLECQIDKDPFQ